MYIIAMGKKGPIEVMSKYMHYIVASMWIMTTHGILI